MNIEKYELVVNWHITDVCNFKCFYCYANWKKDLHAEKLHKNPFATKVLLQKIHDYFSNKGWENIRLSISGGEPLLAPQLVNVIRQASNIGFRVAIISNGSLFTKDFVRKVATDLWGIGVSIDSVSFEKNCDIGRCTKNRKVIDIDYLKQVLCRFRQINPGIFVKVNTVVSELNFEENLNAFINEVLPDKWKIFQVLPSIDPQIAITKRQFHSFLKRHNRFSGLIYNENNNAMIGSYIMIDPYGRFFDNSLLVGSGQYLQSQPILEVGAKKAFKQVAFNKDMFLRRYQLSTTQLEIAC